MTKIKSTSQKLRQLALILTFGFSIGLQAQTNNFQDRVPIKESLYGINAWELNLGGVVNLSAFYEQLPIAS